MTVQISQEQFQELLGRMSAIHSTANKNFTECTLSYHGERDRTKVDQFINAVIAFKQLEKIPDEDALFGLPLLMKDAASTWWAKVRSEVNSWTEALERIRSHFAPTPPPYEVYMQIFAKTQGVDQVIDDFLIEKRQLLALLPPDRHSEEVQLDLIYGLLKQDLRKDICRSDVSSFKELAEKARRIESLERTAKLTKAIQPPIGKKPKKRCSFCRYKGHTLEMCKKRATLIAEVESESKRIAAGVATSDSSIEQRKNRMVRMIEAQLKNKTAVPLPLDLESMTPKPKVYSTDSPMSPPLADAPTLQPKVSSSFPVSDSPMSPPVADSPMSPTSTDDEEPSIFCFGCGAPNVWRSICTNCRNTDRKKHL